ncbi:hypothetical protein NLJ89_g11788 [Agrocybe chaxingu]|uniref:FCP1 homology domain-containing protein n=1 Tax=Agrocybe chaxingu TaxID=84603 RepID=A0A9W8MMQ6_9AGAR|nr:hypothetical protein NLJ89_g11788 [Agrocybe chaxingu]
MGLAAVAQRPSLRDRLFSTSSKKAPQNEPHPAEAAPSTLTNNKNNNRRIPFYRRKPAAALSSSTSHSLVKPPSGPSRSPKPSFFSRVVTKVVPCVSAPETPVAPSDNNNPSSFALKDISNPDISNSQNGNELDISPPLAAGFTLPPPSSNPPSPTDSDVIIPPPVSATLLPEDETDGMTSGAVQPPGSSGTTEIVHTHTHDSSEDSDRTSYSDDEADANHIHEEQDEEERLIKAGGAGIPIGPDGVPKPLLPPIAPEHVGRKCLVLDLDETLVHSSFKAIQQADFVVPVEIEYHWHHFHILKRPGVDNFLKHMGELYEVVVFTASLSKYADPVLDKLDIHRVVAHRLFRESCFNHKGNYVKDLSQLGRPIADTIILDNSPASYIFHPNNAVPVSSWFNDPHDAELTDLIPFLGDLTQVPDVRGVLDGAR